MEEPVEREFKLRIPGEREFRRVLARLGGLDARPTRQTNHFFDTADGALRRARIALRLREEDGRFTLTLKGPARAEGAELSARPEVELEIDPEDAAAVLGGASALAPLAAGPLASRALVREALALCAHTALRRLGSFENERTRVGPLTLPWSTAGEPLILELDRTRYPGEVVEHELEVEIQGPEQAAAVGAGLRALFTELGLPFEGAPSKAARFLRILDARDGG